MTVDSGGAEYLCSSYMPPWPWCECYSDTYIFLIDARCYIPIRSSHRLIQEVHIVRIYHHFQTFLTSWWCEILIVIYQNTALNLLEHVMLWLIVVIQQILYPFQMWSYQTLASEKLYYHNLNVSHVSNFTHEMQSFWFFALNPIYIVSDICCPTL